MWKEYFRILKIIPKAHFGIYIILIIGSLLTTQFITNEEKNINYERLIYGLIGFAILIPVWVQIQWTRFDLMELLKKPEKTNGKKNNVSNPPLRHLTYTIEIEPYKIDRVLISLSVTRRWYPDAGMPSASDFISDLTIGRDYLCYKCNHTYVRRLGKIRSSNYEYYCSNEKCKNHENYYEEHEWNSLIDKGKLEIHGDIRNNKEKYWEMYRREYLKLTNNIPELYTHPSTTYNVSMI